MTGMQVYKIFILKLRSNKVSKKHKYVKNKIEHTYSINDAETIETKANKRKM